MSTAVAYQDLHSPQISRDEALEIARFDAVKVYRDLSAYQICVDLESDGWHVDYELQDAELQGGGPHYVIDPANGEILGKRYEQ